MPVCFDIGGTNIRSGWPDEVGIVQIAGQRATPGDSLADFLATMVDMVQQAPAAQQDFVAISIAGFADPQTGALTIANIPCLKGENLAGLLEARLNMPVVVVNDADCLALAETYAGAAKGAANVFAIVLGTGVGGGLVLNGELVVGVGGISGEWGHGPIVDPTAGGRVESLGYFQCGCGQKGCLDTVGGARGIENVHNALHNAERNAEQILDAWRAGDEAAALSVEVSTEMVARALSAFVNMLGPESIPVGGGLAHAKDLIALIDQKVRGMVLTTYELPLVVPAHNLKNAGLVGAAFINPTSGRPNKVRGVS
ncbi:ROK family protein [Maritalea mediterranea]|uniref:N-acetylglucosamine kinase n=1 Tax=Maritalea mediterranea TaxID=2909667 RepID=A0ABS9E625_9HYPH|nr:ROK family protein [Maritalea mediterranea]MCF4097704.1 ROK family protein [Maritalea mediterranea]